MAELSLSSCMQVVNKMLPADQDAVLQRLEQLEAEGVPREQAQLQAAQEVLARLEAEGGEDVRRSTLRTIEVDGVRRPDSNSQGQIIYPMSRGMQGLVNFWRWFGDSKVVDEQGRPRVMYHGTRADFDVFDTTRYSMWGEGAFFTSDAETAAIYAGNAQGDGPPRVIPVYLKVESDDDGSITDRGVMGLTVQVKSPSNIKSATGNDGSFDAQDANIARSTRRDFNPELPRGYVGEPTQAELELEQQVQDAEKRAGELWAEGKKKSMDRILAKLLPQIKAMNLGAEAERSIAQNLFHNERAKDGDNTPEFAAYRDMVPQVEKLRERRMQMIYDRIGPPEFEGIRQLKDFHRPITETKAFKDWFKDSKAVDEEGRPLIALHGTNRDFTEFRTVLPGDKQVSNNNWMGELGSWFAAPRLAAPRPPPTCSPSCAGA
jgi:hypothetical protein